MSNFDQIFGVPDSQAVQAAKKSLNFYDGRINNYDGDINMFGGSGANGYQNPNLTFQINLVNNGGGSGVDTCYLSPGLSANTDDGVIADGNFADAAGNAARFTGSVPSGQPTIASFLKYIQYNPSQLVLLDIKSDSSDQSQQTMFSQIEDAFKTNGQNKLLLSSYIDQNTFNDKIVKIRDPRALINMQFNNQNKISLPVPEGSTLTIILGFGKIQNLAGGLDRAVHQEL